MNRLDGKVALITGGARGQGASEAELFADAGALVVITDVLDDEGKALAERLGPNVSYLHQDVSVSQEWADTVAAVVALHGRLDVLVNNAGIFQLLALENTTDEAWAQVIAVNQTSVFYGMREVAPVMKEQGSGSIINISSIAGMTGTAMGFAYGASKWAIRGMTKGAAIDLGPHGIRVNSVHPGLIDTDMLHQLPAAPDFLLPRVPLGRFAAAEEVAQLVRYLASDDSAYCSGQEFVVDGAMTA